jgi:hypothetical protein
MQKQGMRFKWWINTNNVHNQTSVFNGENKRELWKYVNDSAVSSTN